MMSFALIARVLGIVACLKFHCIFHRSIGLFTAALMTHVKLTDMLP